MKSMVGVLLMSRPFDIAYNAIKDNILQGVYLPSQKLIETELSDAICVSRNTIKKALLTLEKENLVTLEKNKGAIVKAFNIQEVINYMEIRECLEGIIASTAAVNITDQQLLEMEDMLDEMNDLLARREYKAYSACNRKFHGIIYSASSNPQASEMVQTIRMQLQRLSGKTLALSDRPDNSYEEHYNILQALKARDKELSKKLARNHVAQVKDIIVDNYSLFI